jgi:hypothetical protein
MNLMHPQLRGRYAAAVLALAVGAGCRDGSQARLAESGISPIYNPQTGRLEQLVSDRDRDGRQETRAFMDGGVIKYVEIDRNGDGVPDRWEYYGSSAGAAVGGSGAANVIDHAEEANGPDRTITRREFYADGVIRRVVDDTNFDGRPDKWEQYDHGVLASVEMDLVGKGFPSQRLRYNASGEVVAVETDPDGRGVFQPVSPPSKVKR